MTMAKSMPRPMQFALLLIGLSPLVVSALESNESDDQAQNNESDDQALKYFPNINFVGRGYNIYMGNPQSDFVDPGFRMPIYETGLYDTQKISTSGEYAIPDGIDAFVQTSCNTAFSSEIVSDNKTFTNTLMLGIGGDFTLFGVPFSGNFDFQRRAESLSSENCVFLQSISKCELYSARIEKYRSLPRTSNFDKALDSLPPKYSEETKKEYMKFLRTFGTHVVTEVEMGARLVVSYQFSATAYSRLLGNNLNMGLVASAVSDLLLGGEAGVQVSSVEQEEFMNSQMSMSIMSTGSRAPPTEDIEGWLMSDFEDPAPVRYELGLISKVVGNIRPQVEAEVEGALRDFCREHAGADCNSTQIFNPPVAVCSNPQFSEQWFQTVGPSHNSFGMKKRLACAAGEALTALRVSRKRYFSFLPTNDQFIDIGCTTMTSRYEVAGSDRWRPAVSKVNGSYIGCDENEFITGISFMHKCLQVKPFQELVSIACRRSSEDHGECHFTDWVTRVRRRPQWTEVNCPLGYAARGIQYMYEGNSNSLDAQSVRFRCCKAPYPCVSSLPATTAQP